jgi:hypothetical protein
MTDDTCTRGLPVEHHSIECVPPAPAARPAGGIL